MDSVHEDSFVVFVRFDGSHTEPPTESVEHPLASCPSYEEARRLRESLHGSPCEYVIRYVGPAGGGD